MIEKILISFIIIISIAIFTFAINSLLRLRNPDKKNNDDISSLHNYSVPVIIVQKGGKISYYNNELRKLFGFSKQIEFDLNLMDRKAKGDESLFKVFNQSGTYEFEIEGKIIIVNSFHSPDGMMVFFQDSKVDSFSQSLESSEQKRSPDSQLSKTSLNLGELAKISYSLKQLSNFEDLFNRILASIEDLFPFEIIGFILFDDHSQMLEAKKPFKGIPDPIVDIIRIKILPNSDEERILFSQDLLITENAIEDKTWSKLGLSHLANAASIRDSVLVPLTPSGDPMGYILAANHNDKSTTFTQDEIHLLIIISNQIAPTIENMHLLLQAKQRTQRSETLRRISALASSNATIEEILSFTINEFALLLQAELGLIYLFDQFSSKLAIKTDIGYGKEEIAKPLSEISSSSSIFLDTVTNLKKPLLLGKFDETEPIPAFYQELMTAYGLQSAIIVPLMTREASIGEIIFGSNSISFFDQNDVQLILSAANQIATVIDKESLSTKALEAFQDKIEQEKLIDDLYRINEFANKISLLNEFEILEVLLDTILEFIPHADAGWIGLRNENNQSLSAKLVRNYTEELLNLQFLEHNLFYQITETGNIVCENEVDFPRIYKLTEDQAIRYLQSTEHQIPTACLLAPILSGGNYIGIFLCEIFDKEKQFRPEDESIITSLLQQVNLSLAKAELFKRAETQSKKLVVLSELSKSISANLEWIDLQNSLLTKLSQIVEYDNATLWIKDEKYLRIAATNGFDDFENREGIIVQLDDSALFSEMFETKKSIVISDKRNDPRFPIVVEDEVASWLGIPLISQSEILAVIALEKKEIGFFTPDLIQLAEGFASQAAVAMTNATLYKNSVKRMSELDEQTKKLDLLNKYSSEVNQSLEIDQICDLTINYLKNVLSCDYVSVFLLDNETLEVEIYQYQQNYNSQENIIIFTSPFFQQLIQTRGIYNIADVSLNNEIQVLKEKFLSERETQSILFVPLISKDDVVGWVGLESINSRRFDPHEIELALTIANHTALALKNAELYQESKLFNEDLESKVRERSNELLIENRNTEMLLKVSTELSSSLDVDQILDRILLTINNSMKIAGSFIYTIEGQRIVKATDLESLSELNILQSLFIEKVDEVIKSKETTVLNNLNHLTDLNGDNWLITPLKFGEMILGVLILVSQSQAIFSNRDIEVAEALAGQISIAINNAEIFRLVRDQSEYLGSMLREQEIETTRSKAILEAIADGVVVTGTQSEVVLINKSARKIMEIGDEPFSKSIFNLGQILGKQTQNWITEIQNWTDDPSILDSNDIFSENIQLENNQFLSVHLAPVFWKNEFMGTVSIFRDISIQMQIDQLKSDFISNISHELRTPLTSIKGYVEVLLLGTSGKLNDQQTRFLKIIDTNTERLTNLVEEILDVNKISSNNIPSDLHPINVLEMIDKIIDKEKMNSQVIQKGLKIHFTKNGNIPIFEADAARIEQIISNILKNAIDYSYPDEVIELSVTAENQTLRITVKDHGIGIPKEEQNLVFDRFFRGKNAIQMNTAGAGLGLSIAKTLIELQNGSIDLFSSGVPGEGVTVTITIPFNLIEVIKE